MLYLMQIFWHIMHFLCIQLLEFSLGLRIIVLAHTSDDVFQVILLISDPFLACIDSSEYIHTGLKCRNHATVSCHS